MKDGKRAVDLIVISDVHLGTRGSHAKELLAYLKTVQPKILILNGDIIDVWQFSKRYWPQSHMKVIKYILGLTDKKTKVYYITGNHDEIFRKFANTRLGHLRIVNQLILKLEGEKTWFFHGDVFDVIMQHSKWLAKAGAIGYDSLIILNNTVNWVSRMLGRGKVSLSKRIKENVKTAIKYIHNFEDTAATLSVKKGYSTIVCGHIHHPDKREIIINKKSVLYLNSGDWIENLSALEYHEGDWKVVYYRDLFTERGNDAIASEEEQTLGDMKNKQLFNLMLKEFQS
ncbi:MAG: UDP-2,3-diacylglucosamine hydrolase [Bacteroidetes bacterium HGW-Bacteroidetes-1]|jgi:UDP-2,3-diacylglucosamine pyrophosphatase LpxH|nr:MAG: UDP-2,3-diacylglucosamine hydrolase [Bacteroidetes bacterium HGW-Bacteroidetes-1]